MGDVQELKELVSALVAENIRMSQESARRDAQPTDEMAKLIAALTQRPQQVLCCCSLAQAVVENPLNKFPSVCRVSSSVLDSSAGLSISKVDKGKRRGFGGRSGNSGVGGKVSEAGQQDQVCPQQQQQQQQQLSGVKKNDGRCFKCNRFGHYQRNCRSGGGQKQQG